MCHFLLQKVILHVVVDHYYIAGTCQCDILYTISWIMPSFVSLQVHAQYELIMTLVPRVAL